MGLRRVAIAFLKTLDPVEDILICGHSDDQHGIDKTVEVWWMDVMRGAGFIFPPMWSVHGKPAGAIRNTRMLVIGRPDICHAFPGPESVGTWDMVNKAKRAGIPVEIHNEH